MRIFFPINLANSSSAEAASRPCGVFISLAARVGAWPKARVMQGQQRNNQSDEHGLWPIEKFDSMIAAGKQNTAQVVVDPQSLYRASVKVSAPARIIVIG